MAMVAAFKFDDFIAPRVAASKTDRRHGGFGTAVDHTHHFKRRHDFAEKLGNFDFHLNRCTETGADIFQGILKSCRDFGVHTAKNERAPRTDIIKVAVAINVGHVCARPFGHVDWSSANGFECSNGRVHAAGNKLLCFFKEFN